MTQATVNETLTFQDLETPICAATCATTAARDFIEDLLCQNAGKGTLTERNVNSAIFLLNTASGAIDRAQGDFYTAFKNQPKAKPVTSGTFMNDNVSVPSLPRVVDINDVSLSASALWRVIDYLENLMGDADEQDTAFSMAHVARQLAQQLDRDLRAMAGAS